jgi:hypothetical protein
VTRIPSKLSDIAAIDARREALRAELAKLDEQARAAEVAARDAGRSILLSALNRVKIAAMDKKDAKLIAGRRSLNICRRSMPPDASWCS